MQVPTLNQNVWVLSYLDKVHDELPVCSYIFLLGKYKIFSQNLYVLMILESWSGTDMHHATSNVLKHNQITTWLEAKVATEQQSICKTSATITSETSYTRKDF